jgi:hypothetical protein
VGLLCSVILDRVIIDITVIASDRRERGNHKLIYGLKIASSLTLLAMTNFLPQSKITAPCSLTHYNKGRIFLDTKRAFVLQFTFFKEYIDDEDIYG